MSHCHSILLLVEIKLKYFLYLYLHNSTQNGIRTKTEANCNKTHRASQLCNMPLWVGNIFHMVCAVSGLCLWHGFGCLMNAFDCDRDWMCFRLKCQINNQTCDISQLSFLFIFYSGNGNIQKIQKIMYNIQNCPLNEFSPSQTSFKISFVIQPHTMRTHNETKRDF